MKVIKESVFVVPDWHIGLQIGDVSKIYLKPFGPWLVGASVCTVVNKSKAKSERDRRREREGEEGGRPPLKLVPLYYLPIRWACGARWVQK